MWFANRLLFLSATVLLFTLSSTLMLSVSATGNQEEAASAVSEAAQGWMMLAYEVVLGAERVGANVSGLLVRLNDAAAMLSQARMAFEVGDFEEATRFAESTSKVGMEIMEEAELLETEANNAQIHRSWWFMGASALGVSTVLVVSILGYEYFKRRYYKRLSKMKPRVGQP